MFVITSLRRYRLPFLLFNLCLVAVFLFTNKANSSQLIVGKGEGSNAQPTTVISKEKTPLSLTENVRKTVLENGLTVLTKEVHTAPVVTVQVWYEVGSRNEQPGVNGIAHQLEHMMFKGTKSRPIQFGRLFSALGSDSNAFTSYDQTAYFGTVERNKLKPMLVLEADRIQNAVINAEQLASEKRVVISELQGYENSPEYRLSRAVMRKAFPNHPYGLPVGGTKADVQKFTVDQVREYYRKFYNPENATLVIVGDFKTEQALQAVKETFGKIANTEQRVLNTELKVTPRTQERQSPPSGNAYGAGSSGPSTPIVLREPGAGALLQAVYPLPNVNHPDIPALDVMDYILTGGRSSRLYQALVKSGLASQINGYAASLNEGGWYDLSATAAPGQDLATIDSVLQQAIADLRNKGVTQEEVDRAKAQVKAAIILNNRDITSQAMQLGYDLTTSGDYRYTDRYLAAIDKLSAADVQRVASKYLTPANRTVGFFEPTQQTQQASGGIVASTPTTENFSPGEPVDPDQVAKYLPPVDSTTTPTAQALPEQITLPNGLRILLFPDNSTPTVTLSGYIKAGSEFDANNKGGLASLTAENLMNGTKTNNALTIAKVLADRGASLDFTARREGVDIEGHSLAPDLPTLIQTLADVVQNPSFPANELELSQKRALTGLKLQLDDPGMVAIRTFQQTIYPQDHPFHIFPTEDSLKSISREDVTRFHATNYRPDTTVLALVGDFQPNQVRSLIQSELGDWQATGKPPVVKYPTVEAPEKVVSVNPVLPGKTQSVTYMGYKGIERKDPRYYSALVLNQILGGDTLSSRLGSEVRDRQGLTYGIYSYFQAGKQAGPFLISMQTAPEDAIRAIASTRQLLQQIGKQGVSAAEVETAKRSLISSYNVSLANPDELSSRILMNEVYGLSEEELRSFTENLQAVTVAEVNQAAKELLHPDNIVVVTAGPPVILEQGKR